MGSPGRQALPRSVQEEEQIANPKTVSEMLGHPSIVITLDTYSHALPYVQESVVRALEEALT